MTDTLPVVCYGFFSGHGNSFRKTVPDDLKQLAHGGNFVWAPLVRLSDAQEAADERDRLRVENERLSRANAALLDQMHHFAHADQKLWDESMRAPEDFERWVRSRATHMLAQFNGRASVLDDGGTK